MLNMGVIDTTLSAALVASITTILGFFINNHFSRSRKKKNDLRAGYYDLIAYSRNIRRTLIAFHEFDISFTNMAQIVREQDVENQSDLDISKKAAFNYEENANKYRDVLAEQQYKLDRSFFTIISIEKDYKIAKWRNKAKGEDDKRIQDAVNKVLSYNKSPKTIDNAKYEVDKYFEEPLTTLQEICTKRARGL